MDIRKIKKLIELLEQSSLTEMEIHEGETAVRLSRQLTVASAPVLAPVVEPVAETSSTISDKAVVPATPDGQKVESPMVGTYYSAPSPGHPDFVTIGSTVAAGDTLCVVEAMKIFNQIECAYSGTVVAILKKNGDPVEYGETLFIIE